MWKHDNGTGPSFTRPGHDLTAIGYAIDLGLLAEEIHPGTRELLGNFPQAFSHFGLVNAAWAIAQAEKGLSPDGGPL